MVLATSSVVELFTPPSRMPTATPSLEGCFRSVIGVEVSVTFSSRVTMRSSMSSSDMWQPAQPAIQSLATVTLSVIQPISFCNFARVASSAGMPSGGVVKGTTAISRPSMFVTWPLFSVHTWAGSTTSAPFSHLPS